MGCREAFRYCGWKKFPVLLGLSSCTWPLPPLPMERGHCRQPSVPLPGPLPDRPGCSRLRCFLCSQRHRRGQGWERALGRWGRKAPSVSCSQRVVAPGHLRELALSPLGPRTDLHVPRAVSREAAGRRGQRRRGRRPGGAAGGAAAAAEPRPPARGRPRLVRPVTAPIKAPRADTQHGLCRSVPGVHAAGRGLASGSWGASHLCTLQPGCPGTPEHAKRVDLGHPVTCSSGPLNLAGGQDPRSRAGTRRGCGKLPESDRVSTFRTQAGRAVRGGP